MDCVFLRAVNTLQVPPYFIKISAETSGSKRRKPVKERSVKEEEQLQPHDGGQPPQPPIDPHKHLIYGRSREGEDSLLPGYVSRPNPSPTSRLLEPSSNVSPLTLPCSRPSPETASAKALDGGPRRRLQLDTISQTCTTRAVASAGKQAARVHVAKQSKQSPANQKGTVGTLPTALACTLAPPPVFHTV